MTKTKGFQAHAPSLAKIWHRVFRQAAGAVLLPQALALAVIHLHGLNPQQRPSGMETKIQGPFKNLQGCLASNLYRGSGMHGQRLDQPARSQAVNVAVPDLSAVAKNQIAEGLNLQAMAKCPKTLARLSCTLTISPVLMSTV